MLQLIKAYLPGFTKWPLNFSSPLFQTFELNWFSWAQFERAEQPFAAFLRAWMLKIMSFCLIWVFISIKTNYTYILLIFLHGNLIEIACSVFLWRMVDRIWRIENLYRTLLVVACRCRLVESKRMKVEKWILKSQDDKFNLLMQELIYRLQNEYK